MQKSRFLPHLAIALITVLALLALLSSQARAVEISVNVGGTVSTFDVLFVTTSGGQGTSFDDASPLIENVAPWWGNVSVADDFVAAYISQVPTPFPFDVSPTTDALLFAFSSDGLTHSVRGFEDDGDTLSASGVGNSLQITNTVFYAYVKADPVPEIDGGALGQGAVILLAFWLTLRRRLA